MPDFELERPLWRAGVNVVVGIDEAGRGPWAGPVVAAAVILDATGLSTALRQGLGDSKKLSAPKRAALYDLLRADASVGVGIADVDEIDRINILQATLSAMARAVGDLGLAPGHALVDGTQAPKLTCPVDCIVKGDSRSLSIAAASIIAKVTRDRLMADLARRYPGYGWERNAGYGTAEHRAALASLGVTPAHRRSYAPIRKMLRSDPDHTQDVDSKKIT